MEHEWTKVRPYQMGNELLARVVCARCPAEKKMWRDPDKGWCELTEGSASQGVCAGESNLTNGPHGATVGRRERGNHAR